MIETNNGNKFAFDAIKIGMASPEHCFPVSPFRLH